MKEMIAGLGRGAARTCGGFRNVEALVIGAIMTMTKCYLDKTCLVFTVNGPIKEMRVWFSRGWKRECFT